MKKLLLTILLNVLLLLLVMGRGGVHGYIRYGDGRSGEAVGLQVRVSEGVKEGKLLLRYGDDVIESTGKYYKGVSGITPSPGFLSLFDNLPNLKSWVSTFDQTADAQLIARLQDLDAGYLVKLETDIASTSMGPELKALLKESPDDLTDIWKSLKDDPKYAYEFSKTGGARWDKWAQGNYFKTVTKAGKDFEEFVVKNTSTLRTKILNKYPDLDINDYEIFTQVQMKTGVGDEYFVADMVLVKRNIDEFGDLILDKNNVIVLESKLSSGTNLTTPQSNALKKVQSSSNTFDVRSVSLISDGGFPLKNTDNLKVNDFIKVWSDGNGGIINDIVSMK